MTTSDAVEAGDTTLVTSRIEALKTRVEHLKLERWGKEMSDDFAFTNGSIRRIDEQIAEARKQLADLLMDSLTIAA